MPPRTRYRLDSPSVEAAVPPEVSVIVPVLDEAARVPALIEGLQAQRGIKLEIILSDGGSRDGSAAAAEYLGAIVVHAPPGRGAQMNAAAALAMAPFLCFLHADSRLTRPDQLARALHTLKRAEAQDRRVAGHFTLRFERARHRHRWLYRYMEAKTALNRAGTFNGDQGLLIGASYFRSLGGFDQRLPFLEDQRLSARIHTSGRWVTLPDTLVTSARRFEAEGLYRRYILMALIMGLEYSRLFEFFTRAPHVYRAQADTERLQLSPFIALIRQCLHARSAPERRLIWADVGRYARDNAWQPFYLLDVVSGRAPRTAPCLNTFDRHVRPHLQRPWVAAVLGVMVRLWVMGALRAYFGLTEKAG